MSVSSEHQYIYMYVKVLGQMRILYLCTWCGAVFNHSSPEVLWLGGRMEARPSPARQTSLSTESEPVLYRAETTLLCP